MAIAGGDLTARNDILRTMNEEQGFRKTGTTGTAVGTNNIPSDASPSQTDDFSMLEPREQLRRLIAAEMEGKPFCELAGVTFDHRGAAIVGHILLDALEENGYSIDDFDAVGAARSGRRRGRSTGRRDDSGGGIAR